MVADEFLHASLDLLQVILLDAEVLKNGLKDDQEAALPAKIENEVQTAVRLLRMARKRLMLAQEKRDNESEPICSHGRDP